MANKELQRLKRQDLLELLLAQTKEVEQQKLTIQEYMDQITELEELVERLKDRLDDKDRQIERLKKRLDQKDERIKELRELGRIRTDAEISLDLEEMFEVAKNAAAVYMKEQLAKKDLLEEYPEDEDLGGDPAGDEDPTGEDPEAESEVNAGVADNACHS